MFETVVSHFNEAIALQISPKMKFFSNACQLQPTFHQFCATMHKSPVQLTLARNSHAVHQLNTMVIAETQAQLTVCVCVCIGDTKNKKLARILCAFGVLRMTCNIKETLKNSRACLFVSYNIPFCVNSRTLVLSSTYHPTTISYLALKFFSASATYYTNTLPYLLILFQVPRWGSQSQSLLKRTELGIIDNGCTFKSVDMINFSVQLLELMDPPG